LSFKHRAGNYPLNAFFSFIARLSKAEGLFLCFLTGFTSSFDRRESFRRWSCDRI